MTSGLASQPEPRSTCGHKPSFKCFVVLCARTGQPGPTSTEAVFQETGSKDRGRSALRLAAGAAEARLDEVFFQPRDGCEIYHRGGRGGGRGSLRGFFVSVQGSLAVPNRLLEGRRDFPRRRDLALGVVSRVMAKNLPRPEKNRGALRMVRVAAWVGSARGRAPRRNRTYSRRDRPATAIASRFLAGQSTSEHETNKPDAKQCQRGRFWDLPCDLVDTQPVKEDK